MRTWNKGETGMALKKPRPKVQLTFDEYVDVWQQLVNEFYCRCMGDKKLFNMLLLSDEMYARFSIESATIILLIAMYNLSEKDMHKKTKSSVKDAVVPAFYEHLFPDAPEDVIKGFVDFFNSKYKLFSEVFRCMDGKNKEKYKTKLIGFARYLIAQVSPDDEKGNPEAIEHLSILLFEAESAFSKLVKNSSQDAIGMPGKPRFIVQK